MSSIVAGMPKRLLTGLEFAGYLLAIFLFFALRLPYLPAWWADFNADHALVGVMAKHTLEGHFPIFYYGQTYMGGAEWATAALATKLSGASVVSLDILRLNSLGWWFLASAAWVVFLRRFSRALATSMAFLLAIGTYTLIRLAMIQDMAAEYLFFGAVVALLLQRFQTLRGARGFYFGVLLGLAWWTNQTIVFILVPALWVWHAEPGRWLHHPAVEEFRRPEQKLRWLYALAAFLALFGLVVGFAGGVTIPLGRGHLKIPNGVTLARDVILVLFVVQAIFKYAWRGSAGRRGEAFSLARKAMPFFAGFLLGYAPVWGGRLLGLYEKAHGVGLAVLPFEALGAQARDLLLNLDTLLLSSLLQKAAGPLAPFAMAVVLVGAGLLARARWSQPLVRVAFWSICLNIIYVYFSYRARGAPVRYFYLAFVNFWVIVSCFLLQLRSRRAAIAAMAFIVGAFGVQSRFDARALAAYYRSMEWRRDNVQGTLAELERRGADVCWGDLWSSYLLIYLSNERLVMSPHPDSPANYVRVPAYHRRLEAANPLCYVSFDSENRMHISETNPWVAARP